MNQNFLNQIQQLQQNNVVVLRNNRGAVHRELLRQLAQGYNYVDMALPLAYQQARRNAQSFVQNLPLPVYLDNLQYAPQLLTALAQVAGASSVLASCTQSFAITRQAEKLPQVQVVDVPVTAALGAFENNFAAPFRVEQNYLGNLAKRQPVNLLQTIYQGLRSSYAGGYGGYLQAVLQSDIMFLTTVSDSEKFYCFMEAAATMTGKLVNYVKLAQAAGITPPTAKTWLKFLLGTGIVYLLQPVKNIGLKRIVSTPKLYFRDTGLACELLGLADVQELERSEYLLQLKQNYALNQIRESYLNAGLVPRLRFYRDNNKKSIDVIVRCGDKLYPLLLPGEQQEAEKVQFAFSVLTEYAKVHELELSAGVILHSNCQLQQLLPGLWQLPITLL